MILLLLQHKNHHIQKRQRNAQLSADIKGSRLHDDSFWPTKQISGKLGLKSRYSRGVNHHDTSQLSKLSGEWRSSFPNCIKKECRSLQARPENKRYCKYMFILRVS